MGSVLVRFAMEHTLKILYISKHLQVIGDKVGSNSCFRSFYFVPVKSMLLFLFLEFVRGGIF